MPQLGHGLCNTLGVPAFASSISAAAILGGIEQNIDKGAARRVPFESCRRLLGQSKMALTHVNTRPDGAAGTRRHGRARHRPPDFSRKGRDSGGVLESVRFALAEVRGLGARCLFAQDRARHRIGRNVMQSFNVTVICPL